MADGITPHNEEAEQMAIACALTYDEAIDDFAKLTEQDFFSPRLKAIYKTIASKYANGEAIDMITVAEGCNATTASELAEIASQAYSPAIMQSTLQSLKEHSRRRTLLRLANELNNRVYGGEDSQLIITDANAKLEQVSSAGEREPTPLEDIVQPRLAEYIAGEQERGVKTGLVDLDRQWAGMIPQELTVLAARPSMGKTQLGLHLAEQHAKRTGLPSLFFSIEMPDSMIADRFISRLIGESSDKLRQGYVSRELLRSVSTEDLAQVYLLDQSELTTFQVQSHARKLKRRQGLGAMFIDFLTLLADERERGQNEHQHISAMTRKLRTIAKNLQVPVVVLAQLSRSVEQRENKRPRLSDLRESGGIEEAADNVLLLYREEYYHPETSKVNQLEIGVAKQKQGPRSVSATVGYDASTGRFFNLANE